MFLLIHAWEDLSEYGYRADDNINHKMTFRESSQRGKNELFLSYFSIISVRNDYSCSGLKQQNIILTLGTR